MATVTSTINTFQVLSEKICDGTIDLDVTTADTFKIALLVYGDGSANAPDGTETSAATVLSGVEAAGNGYTAGGQGLTAVTWNRSGATTTWDFANPLWTASGGNLGGAELGWWILYHVASDTPMFWGLIDGTPAGVTTVDGDVLILEVNTSGLFTLT